ncbi:MAG: hypothetical protein IPQ08_12515 [Chitinophagaceae bacterium]|nr:hypothetical protein [Chitinophagaceae bacterium]
MQLLKNDYKTLVTLDKAAHTRNVTSDYLLIEDGQVWPLQTELDSFYAGQPDKNKSRNDFLPSNISVWLVIWPISSGTCVPNT